ncbi:MAG: terminase gpP N-terminus-related DNA-binding protein, partial [Pseudomonas sp.]
MPYLPEVKDAARKLYLRRYKPREIQAQLKLPNIRIVYYWIAKGSWDELLTDEEPLTAVSRRITLILEKVETLGKTELDELDRLLSVRERLQKQAIKPAPRSPEDPPSDTGGERRTPRDRS